MRRLVLVLLVACQSDPTLSGGRPSPAESRLVFVRTTLPVLSEDSRQLFYADGDDFEGRALATPPGNIVTPRVSPDGRRVAYSDGRWVHVLNLGTGATQQLTPPAASDRWPSWNGDGSRLLVLRRHGTTGPAHLVSVGQDVADSTRFVALTNPDNSDPNWSPNGEHVVRVHWASSQIELISVPSGDVVEIVAGIPGFQVRSPVWASTGDRLGYVRHGPNDSSTVVVVTPTGIELTNVRVAGYPTQLAWEPGGRRLAFCRYAGERLGSQRYEVVVWDVGTARVHGITPQDASDCQVSWGARPR